MYVLLNLCSEFYFKIYLPSWKLKPSTLEKVKPCCSYELWVIDGKNIHIKKVRTKTTTGPYEDIRTGCLGNVYLRASTVITKFCMTLETIVMQITLRITCWWRKVVFSYRLYR